MDRLTTGRRHVRTGSVTVTELLTKQASPTHCTDSSPTELDDVADTIPVAPATHRRPPTKAAQLAKLATLGVATAVLCGAVAVATMIAHQRRETAQPSTRPTVRITGEQALLPDQLHKTPPTPTSVNPPVVAASPEVIEQTASDPLTSQDDNTDTTNTTASADTVTQIGPATDLDLVREFYENLPDAPTSAFELISSDLLNTTLGEFLESWSTVHAVDGLDVVQRADGVLATVRLRLADGSHLRIQQLLTVAESPRRIVGVQLLSAQHN